MAETKETERTREVLVEHLTKEIEIATGMLTGQRTKNNLMVALGPLAILGAVLLSDGGIEVFNRADDARLALLGLAFVASYGVLGFLSAKIESKIWGQCNEWRDVIADLTSQPRDRLRFPEKGLYATYIGIYMSIALFASVAVWVLRKTP